MKTSTPIIGDYERMKKRFLSDVPRWKRLLLLFCEEKIARQVSDKNQHVAVHYKDLFGWAYILKMERIHPLTDGCECRYCKYG